MQKPAENPKQASMAAKRKALIAAKAQPVATVQPTADPSLFSLGQEAKAFAARVDAGFKSSVGKLASVTPSIEATEPRQKAVVGSPGAQGLPGQQGINGTGLPTPPKRVPREIPNWRAKAMLAKLGMLETVEQAISSIPEPQRTVVMLAWNGDAKLARNGPTVLSLAGTLGLTPEQLDAIFIEADSLNI